MPVASTKIITGSLYGGTSSAQDRLKKEASIRRFWAELEKLANQPPVKVDGK